MKRSRNAHRCHWLSLFVTNLFLGSKLAKLAIVIIGDYRVLTVLTRAVRTFDSEASDRPFLVAVRRPVRRGPASSLSRVKVGCFALLNSHRQR
jgi:hypothetical protein